MKSFLNLFGDSNEPKPLVKPLSSVSRVVNENGEPQLKIYPEIADRFDDVRIKDLILAAAVVHDDLVSDNFKVEIFPLERLENPLVRATKNGQTINVCVLVSRFPAEPRPISKLVREELIARYEKNLYESEVGLMEVAPDDETGKMCFFVNYKGLKPLTA